MTAAIEQALATAYADLSRAAEALASGIAWAAGQNCVHTQRIYVERPVFKDLAERLSGLLQALRGGDPFAEETDYGVLVSEEHAAGVEARVTEACRRGATVLVGGERSGRAFAPTLLTGVADDDPLASRRSSHRSPRSSLWRASPRRRPGRWPLVQ